MSAIPIKIPQIIPNIAIVTVIPLLEYHLIPSYLIDKEKMVFAFSTSDYELVSKDITYLKKISKPLILNSNPTLSNYLNHFHHVIEHLGLSQFQMVDNIHIIRQLVEANLGYAAIPISIFHSHFNDSNARLYKLKEYLPTLSLYMTSNGGTPFHKINKHIYEILKQNNHQILPCEILTKIN